MIRRVYFNSRSRLSVQSTFGLFFYFFDRGEEDVWLLWSSETHYQVYNFGLEGFFSPSITQP